MMNLTTLDYEPATVDIDEKFVGGVYARTMRAKKDSFVIGARHKKDNLNVMSEGRMLLQIVSEDGSSETKEVIAPYFYHSKAGTMKIGIMLEDCVWTSFSDSDVESENVYTKSETEQFYLDNKDKKCLQQ